MTCKTASATVWARRSALTSGFAVGSVSEVFTFNRPLPSSVGASNEASTGAMSVTLLGGGLVAEADYSGRSRVGGSVQATTVWISSSAVVSKGVSGAGSALCMRTAL